MSQSHSNGRPNLVAGLNRKGSPSPVDNNGAVIRSIVEEEPESILDHDDEQEWIKYHRRVIQDDSISIQDYLTKLYEHLVRRRYEERRFASEHSNITNNDNLKTSSNCWEVFFKIPD
jgi:hypothetical protein